VEVHVALKQRDAIGAGGNLDSRLYGSFGEGSVASAEVAAQGVFVDDGFEGEVGVLA
jgi:hypothetical protein